MQTTSGAVSGSHRKRDTGELPAEWRRVFRDAKHEAGFYAVFRDGTPIAWYTDANGWTIVDGS